MSTTNIILLNVMILATQAFYMYLSNKAQLKKHAYLYLIAIPIVAALPAIMKSQDLHAYTLYEYGIFFCILFAAIVDTTLGGGFNREFMTDETGRSLIYSYLLLCTAIAFMGNTSVIIKAVIAFLLVSVAAVFILVKKYPAKELLKGTPIAVLSFLCSWTFVTFGL